MKQLSVFLASVAIATMVACGGGGGGIETPLAANIAPIASAGQAQEVHVGALVTLDGSASADGNNDPLTYRWILSASPNGSSAVLDSSTSVRPTFTPDVEGSYVATLIVNDGRVDGASQRVTVTVSGGGQVEITALTKVMDYVNERSISMIFNAEAADLNGDGLEDIVLAGWAPDASGQARNSLIPVKLLIQQLNGTLADKTDELIPNGANFIHGAQRIVIKDFDGDGRPDIFLAGFQDVPSHVAPSVIFWNNGSSFSRVEFPTEVWAHAVCSADLFGTGRNDIVTGGSDGYPSTVYRNHGNRSLMLDRSIAGLSVASAGACTILRDPATGNIGIVVTNVPMEQNFSGYVRVFDSNMRYLSSIVLPGSEEIDRMNLRHDLVNVIQIDLNNDGLMDMVMTDNGDFRLGRPVGRFLALLNLGGFVFEDKSSEYFPDQSGQNIFGYYTRMLEVNSKQNLFIGNPAVQSDTVLWQFYGGKFTPNRAIPFNAATASNYSFTIPYKTNSGALNLLMRKLGGTLGRHEFYTTRLH